MTSPRTARGALPGLVLVALLATGCGDAASDPAPAADSVEPTPEAVAWTPSPDAYAVRDELVAAVREAREVRMVVTGRPSATVVDLSYPSDGERFARRFAWQEGGADLELFQLPTGRVCANRAAADALQAAGNTGMGYLEASDRPYTCTDQGDSTAAFVVYGYAALDPVNRLASLMGSVTVDDLGPETDESGVTTRHVRLQATEADRSLRQAPTTYDLWVDSDARVVRAELTSLDESHGPYVAVLSYDAVPPVVLPAEADRGVFVFHPGVGPGPRPPS